MVKVLSLLGDLFVLCTAINFLVFAHPDDGWHRFTYYIAGMSFGWYCTMRYISIKKGTSNDR